MFLIYAFFAVLSLCALIITPDKSSNGVFYGASTVWFTFATWFDYTQGVSL